jgi:hypothetical protein
MAHFLTDALFLGILLFNEAIRASQVLQLLFAV